MNYVMSDIHGMYGKFKEMLEKINFSEKDVLYILGDCCDRGDESARIFLECMKYNNIHCIMGNHEDMLLRALPDTFGFLHKEYGYKPELDFDIWSACGGGRTCASFIAVGVDKVADIYKYIKTFPYYRTVTVGDKRYLLVHAGFDNYSKDKSLDQYSPEEMIWYGFDRNGQYYEDSFDKIIVGHTPTFFLSDADPVSIFHGKGGNVIDIDCGAVFAEKNGRLACLCLETMEEYYV